MSTTLTIRAVEASELGAVAELWCALQRLHEPFHPCWRVTPESRERFLAGLRRDQGDPATVLRGVVETSGRIVGFCLGRLAVLPPPASEGRLGVIESIHVDSGVRDGGIGTALLTAVIEELRRLGATRVEATVSADNDGAIRFLERARFGLHTVTLSREG